MKNNQKGITIISLIITIIIMLILASVTINVGTGSLENSRMTNFVSYMQTIQAKTDFIAEYDNYLNYGDELDTIQKQALQNILSTEGLLTTTSSTYLRAFNSSKIASELELENIDDEIVIDFNTREVISLNGIEYEDTMYYTQYNLPGGQVLKQTTGELNRISSFESVETNIQGLNATFTIKNISIANGTLSYGKLESEGNIKWTVITNYTTKQGDATTKNITESGIYYFKLVDNITGRDNINDEGNYPSIELRLTNSPKLEENLTDLSTLYNYSDINNSTNWAFATDKTDEANLIYYVWIPRYAYKLDASDKLDELQFLRGTSNVTSSGNYINGTEWIMPDVFEDNTGVWIQVDEAKKERNRYN